MDLADVAAALADFAPEPLAPDAFVVGRLLLAFCNPSLPPDEWPLPDPSGRYVLVLDDGDPAALHLVAVGVRLFASSRPVQRQIADNKHLLPVGFEAAVRRRPYCRYRVVSGWRIEAPR